MKTDILIAGCGCAGLYCALNLPQDKKITLITKSEIRKSDSFLAQGGICVLRDDDDFDSFFEDTLKAGHYENNRESVKIMINSSRETINDLIGYGVDFAKDEEGNFIYTREGAHSRNRILFHHDITGKEITSKLLEEAKIRKNIEIIEYATLLDIIEKDDECVGAIISYKDGKVETVSTEYVVLACGGIGGLYRYSTNYRHLTGDAVAIAINHGVELENLDYIQIHPTTLYSEEKERSFLISESVRGEGAKLYNKDMKRFVDELLPRDLLTEKIREQMEKDNTDFVWEDLRTVPEEELREHFPNIVEHLKEKNYDVFKECVPVVPAQHYFMGGIKVDTDGKTSMKRLYAIGETACNGVHGKNRLASNSLLEGMVFAKRAALSMAANPKEKFKLPEIDTKKYENKKEIEEAYRNIVLDEIKKELEKGEKNYV